jgi:GNAT superfamily N-acetyltransferase
MTIVRRLTASDHARWHALWRGYCAFYRADVADATTARTFAALCAGTELLGLVAVDAGDAAIGFAHLVFHPSTWSTRGYCYLEDMYVAPEQRGGEVGRALIEGCYAEADARGADRVYWHTQEYNAPARSLYDTLGRRTSFIVYRR